MEKTKEQKAVRSTEEQKALDEELIQECWGYDEDDDKPDGAYIREGEWFFNLNKIKRLIASGADVNAKDEDGYTPLHIAAKSDNIDLAKLLIDSGADVNAKNIWGDAPLHSAGCSDNIEMAKFLIDSGADVNAKTEWGTTPLHRAVWMDLNIEIAKLLIDSGADVNAKDIYDSTPLPMAKSEEMEALLIKYGAIE